MRQTTREVLCNHMGASWQLKKALPAKKIPNQYTTSKKERDPLLTPCARRPINRVVCRYRSSVWTGWN